MKEKWYVYLLDCRDRSIYTGTTNDLTRRIKEHNSNNSKGAKSLRGKRPVKLIYFEEFFTQSEALIREAEIKSWKRKQKLELIKTNKISQP